MKKVFSRSLVLALGVALVTSAAFAKQRTGPGTYANYDRQTAYSSTVTGDGTKNLNAAFGAGTTLIYSATFGGKTGPVPEPCTQNSTFPVNQGAWTHHDITGQVGTFVHVDSYASLPLGFAGGLLPADGSKGLWIGSRIDPTGPLCTYLALPGYGNGWNQAFCTKACIDVSDDGVLDVSFLAYFDSEPGYDASQLEYTIDCAGVTGWTKIAGGKQVWDGTVDLITTPYSAAIDIHTVIGTGPGNANVKVRLHFQSDTAWSDEDALWATDGAAHYDDLDVEGLATEGFETPISADPAETTDWITCTPGGYGDYMGVFKGAPPILQEDICATDLSCVWAAINGSTEINCNNAAYPAVPRVNADGLYLSNEIWSPAFPIATVDGGAVINFRYTAYRDEPLDNLIFYVWHIRGLDGVTCPQNWVDRNFVYYGDQKDWIVITNPVGDILDMSKPLMQVAFGVIDLCQYWCPGGANVGTGGCQTGAPYLDQVVVYRVAQFGPQWAIRDIDQFQDTFSTDGTTTGTARADMAQDVSPGLNTGSNIPGDSSVVKVADRLVGLQTDASDHAGATAAYMYVRVQRYDHDGSGVPGSGGTQPARPTGVTFQAFENRLATDNVTGPFTRYPVLGTWTDLGSNVWTKIQLDSSITQGVWQPDFYCVDMRDDLFLPGDTIWFFYEAENTGGLKTYAFGSNLGGSGSSIDDAAAAPSEFTIFPAGGWARGGDVLYVDGMDGRGGQPTFDLAFQDLGWTELVDRYDVRGPSSGVSNRLSGRVVNVDPQLLCYLKIVWDTGDLETNIGDGTGAPEKNNDYKLLTLFMDALQNPGGLYLSGDDIAQLLDNFSGPEAIAFHSPGSYLPYTLISTDLRISTGVVSAVGTPVGGGCYNDTFWIYGGCPLANDFDVVQASGGSVSEVTYGPSNGSNDAVISKVTNNPNSVDVGVILSAFSFIYLRQDDNNVIPDRARFLRDTLVWLGNNPGQPTPVASGKVYKLDQNYPNPFNPQTTIAFSIKERGNVSLKVYNVAGELVRTLANESMTAGDHTKVWDGRNDAGQPVSSGVYFYKLVSNSFQQTKKMVLLK
jgi:hypothetical protein